MNGFWAPLGFFSPFFLANEGFLDVLFRDSKLTMLLSESLGNINCQTTMIAHISDSPANYMETLTTVQLASRIHRMRKKKNKVHKGYSSKPQRSLYSREEIKYWYLSDKPNSLMIYLPVNSKMNTRSGQQRNCIFHFNIIYSVKRRFEEGKSANTNTTKQFKHNNVRKAEKTSWKRIFINQLTLNWSSSFSGAILLSDFLTMEIKVFYFI